MRRGAELLRFAVVGLTALVGGAEVLARPERGVALLAAAALVAAVLAALLPDGLLPPLCLLLLVATHLVATASAGAGARTLGALGAGAALWCLHALLDLVAAVPLEADVDRSVPVRWLERQGLVVAVSLPVALLLVLLGGAAPTGRALPWLGALGAAGLVAAPLLVLRAGRGGARPS